MSAEVYAPDGPKWIAAERAVAVGLNWQGRHVAAHDPCRYYFSLRRGPVARKARRLLRRGAVLALALLAAGSLQGCATTAPRRGNVGDWVQPKPAGLAGDAPLALPVSVGPCVGAHGNAKAGAPLEGLCSTLALSSVWGRTLSMAVLGDWQAGPVGGLGLCGELTDGKRPYEVSLCAGGEYAGRFGWWSAVTFQAKILPEPK